jgi:hypothetical protein
MGLGSKNDTNGEISSTLATNVAGPVTIPTLDTTKPTAFVSVNAHYYKNDRLVSSFFEQLIRDIRARTPAFPATTIREPVIPGGRIYALGSDGYELKFAPLAPQEAHKLIAAQSHETKIPTAWSIALSQQLEDLNLPLTFIHKGNLNVVYRNSAQKYFKVYVELRGVEEAVKIAEDSTNEWLNNQRVNIVAGINSALGDQASSTCISIEGNTYNRETGQYKTFNIPTPNARTVDAGNQNQLIFTIYPWIEIYRQNQKEFINRLIRLTALYQIGLEILANEEAYPDNISRKYPPQTHYFDLKKLTKDYPLDDKLLTYMCEAFEIPFEDFKNQLANEKIQLNNDDNKTLALSVVHNMFEAATIYSKKNIVDPLKDKDKGIPDGVTALLEPSLYPCFNRNILYMLFETTSLSFFQHVLYAKEHYVQSLLRTTIYAVFNITTRFSETIRGEKLNHEEQKSSRVKRPGSGDSSSSSLSSSPPDPSMMSNGQLAIKNGPPAALVTSAQQQEKKSPASEEALINFHKMFANLVTESFLAESNALIALQILHQAVSWYQLVLQTVCQQRNFLGFENDERAFWGAINRILNVVESNAPKAKEEIAPTWYDQLKSLAERHGKDSSISTIEQGFEATQAQLSQLQRLDDKAPATIKSADTPPNVVTAFQALKVAVRELEINTYTKKPLVLLQTFSTNIYSYSKKVEDRKLAYKAKI